MDSSNNSKRCALSYFSMRTFRLLAGGIFVCRKSEMQSKHIEIKAYSE